MSELENVKRKIEDTEADLKRVRDTGQDIVPFIVYLAQLQKEKNIMIQGNPHYISPSIHQRILRPIINDKSFLNDIFMFANAADYFSKYPSMNC
jgi:hypothetical protein